MEYVVRKYSPYVVLAVVIVIAIPFAFAYFKGDITLVKSVLLTLFASLTVISFFSFFNLLEKHPLGIQRSAPTIDGSISGWRLTNSLTLLLITCVFTIATLIIYVDNPKPAVSASADESNKKDNTVVDSQKTTGDQESQPNDSINKTTTMTDSTQ